MERGIRALVGSIPGTNSSGVIALLVVASLLSACVGTTKGGTATPTPVRTPTASPRTTAVAGTSDPGAGEWSTYMGDATRTGNGPPVPPATKPHRTWTAEVDGEVYAEPLVTGRTVIVATEQNWVYALEATTGAIRWRTHLGEPVPSALLECGHIDPNGITSTPVIDPVAGIVYGVAMLNSPTRHEAFALRIADGSVIWQVPADAAGADPGHHQQRGSLNLSQGRVYFSYGGFTGDCGDYHGLVASVAADGKGPLAVWQVPSGNRGAIWAAPGPLVTADGEVWVSTADTDFATAGAPYDGANGVVRLAPDLSAALDWWASHNWTELNRLDVDLGSADPAFVPGGLVFVTGKEGIGYLLRQDHLGGIGGEVFSARVCQTGGPTGGAFGGDAMSGDMVYVPCKDGLVAVRLNPVAPSFAVAWSAARIANSPIIAYGRVWTVISDSGFHRNPSWNGTLFGINPDSGVIETSIPLGPIPHFASPAAAGGSLYVSGLGGVYAISVS
jgi:outer membrane protein assembly factor BamB